MKPIALSRTTLQAATAARPTQLELRLRHFGFGLLLSAVTGAVVGLCGLAISLATLVGLVGRTSTLAEMGILLLVASYPLMFVSAHCLDRMDETRKAIWQEHSWEKMSRENGSLPLRLRESK